MMWREYVPQATRPLTSLVLAGLALGIASGCAEVASNVRSAEEAKGKKILAGRFAFYEGIENPVPIDCKTTRFKVYFNRQGDPKARQFELDNNCYVYVPVTPGQYNLGMIQASSGPFTGTFRFPLDPMPTIQVNGPDDAANFCTLEVKFGQTTGSKVQSFLVGGARASINVKYRPDCDVTQAEIKARVGQFVESVGTVRVLFAIRAH